MEVAVDLPLRELLRDSLNYFATTPALDVVSLRYTSRDGEDHEKYLRDASSFQMGGVLDTWLPDGLTTKLEVQVSTNLVPTTLPDDVVETIALNSSLYPSTIRDVILSDRELADGGKSGRFGSRILSFELRNGSDEGTTIFTFDDFRYNESYIWPLNFRGSGITAISHAIGKQVEYSYEPEPAIKDYLDSLRQAGHKVTCPICNAPFIGEIPCMTPQCVEYRKKEAEDYKRHRSQLQEWLINEAREGHINSSREYNSCRKKLQAEYPDAEILISGAFNRAAGQVIDAYWEANADLKAIVEEEAEKYTHEAIECDREAKRLADELNSLPGFKLFGNGALKAQKDELAKSIEKATDDAKRLREKRDKVLDQLKRLPKR